MSKQSEAKKEQGYNPKPKQKECRNCKFFHSDMENTSDRWGQRWIEEKNMRCSIGEFKVKKTATCDRHEYMTEVRNEI